MAIRVSCPSCKKRFQVSDKFAGKQGPCPSCQTVITIPEKTEEIVVHEPQSFGPKGKSGQGVLKPIFRQEETFPIISSVFVGVSIFLALMLAIVHRFVSGDTANFVILGLMLIALGPAVANGAYFLLRDQDLEAHEGSALWMRTVACGLGYAIIWGVYGMVKLFLFGDADFQLYYLAFLLPPMVAAGGLIGWISLELPDYLTSSMHFGIYLLASGVLLLLANVLPY